MWPVVIVPRDVAYGDSSQAEIYVAYSDSTWTVVACCDSAQAEMCP